MPRVLVLSAFLLLAGPALAVEEPQPLCADVPPADASDAAAGVAVQFGGAGGCAAPPCFHLQEGGVRVNAQANGGREFVVQPSGLLTGCLRLPDP